MIKLQGVSATIVETTSLENLYDLLGAVRFISILLSDSWVIFSLGAVDGKPTEEKKKELTLRKPVLGVIRCF